LRKKRKKRYQAGAEKGTNLIIEKVCINEVQFIGSIKKVPSYSRNALFSL